MSDLALLKPKSSLTKEAISWNVSRLTASPFGKIRGRERILLRNGVHGRQEMFSGLFLGEMGDDEQHWLVDSKLEAQRCGNRERCKSGTSSRLYI